MNEIVTVSTELNVSSYLDCPIFTERTRNITDQISFWIGGVLVCHITITGFILNIITMYVLFTDSTMKNVFNNLFISLIISDNISILFMVFETFATNLGIQTRFHEILYPKFTLPFTNISLTASIFLTIVIAHERYDATRYPISHRQSLISAKARRVLVSKYILGVLVSTIIINMPKFFEAELVWYCSHSKNTTDILLYNTTTENRYKH